MTYEYKVVPAPVRGLKAKGVKTAEDRFALALQTTMNDLAGDGWEYLRADTLPSEQREGLMGKKSTAYQNMLVFRRASVVSKAVKPAPVVTTSPAAPPVRKPSTQKPPVEEPPVQKKIVASAKPVAQDDAKPKADTPSAPDKAAQ